MEILKQFVPSQVCLSCDGCCRFKDEDSQWRPRLGEDERRTGKLFKKVSAPQIDGQGFLKTVPCGIGHLCQFFNAKDHTCGVYGSRPFECALYPFILARTEGHFEVCVHLSCPFVQEHIGRDPFKAYVDYLKGYLARTETLVFLKKNLSLFQDYTAFRDELECLFTVELHEQHGS